MWRGGLADDLCPVMGTVTCFSRSHVLKPLSFPKGLRWVPLEGVTAIDVVLQLFDSVGIFKRNNGNSTAAVLRSRCCDVSAHIEEELTASDTRPSTDGPSRAGTAECIIDFSLWVNYPPFHV